jgi:NIMA (never in mitosis gene a)-related kinase
MIEGLKCLHDMKILHRDLKCANVFLCSDGTAKLGDLNVSKVAKRGLVYTQTGTPYYASPEVWKDQPYDLKSDIWSMGCVLYEAATKEPPFKAPDMKGLYRKVTLGVYPSLPSLYSSDFSQLIASMLKVNPAARPTCDQLQERPSISMSGAPKASKSATDLL